MKLRCLAPESRTLLAFRGPDAERYLNGQLTQDVRDLKESAIPSCVTDAKGRLQAFVHVFRGPEGDLWVEGPAEQEEELEARLGRYLIADDAEIHNISADWQLVHVVDSAEMPPGHTRHCSRITADGIDLWLPAGSPLPDVEILTEAEAETRRIQARIPAWGTELTAGMLPPEAGLDRTSICYRKGCYIGQEVLSRMKTAGKVNRRLVALLVEPEALAGAPLKFDGRPAGTLTSVAPWPQASGLHAALGYLGKTAADAGELEVGEGGTARILGPV